jgi:hypothetical protein
MASGKIPGATPSLGKGTYKTLHSFSELRRLFLMKRKKWLDEVHFKYEDKDCEAMPATGSHS